MPVAGKLTDDDKRLLSQAVGSGNWNDTVDAVKLAHGGQYPEDFYSFVKPLQPAHFELKLQTVQLSPVGSASALNITDMCEVQLTEHGKNMALQSGVRAGDVSSNVFILTPDNNNVKIYAMTGGGFAISRHAANIIAAKRSCGGIEWVRE